MDKIKLWLDIILALVAVGGIVFGAVKWYIHLADKQKKQDEALAEVKKEQCVICYALAACLDGLSQLGCNHSVPKAKEELDKHLNKSAHR